MEVRRHLVEQDQDRSVAVEELDPVALAWRLGTGGPERRELLAFAELGGDLAPEEVLRAVSPVECCDVCRAEAAGCGDPACMRLPQLGVHREKPKADQQVGLAAAHCLLEVEDGLRRLACKPGQPERHQLLHPGGDRGPGEVGGPVALGVDQLIQLLDLVTDRNRLCVRLENAGITDGLHAQWTPRGELQGVEPGSESGRH